MANYFEPMRDLYCMFVMKVLNQMIINKKNILKFKFMLATYKKIQNNVNTVLTEILKN